LDTGGIEVSKKTRWKAITLDWQALQNYDDTEIIAVCLTQREIAILKALLVTAYWPTRWENLGETKDTLESRMAELDGRLDVTCVGIQLQVRQSPTNFCELEYSPDGGNTWYVFADLTACPNFGGESWWIIFQFNLTQISVYNLKYDGTTISINIYAPITIWNDGGTEDREAALCMACMSLVGSIAAMEAQALTVRFVGAALIFAALFLLTGGFAAFGVLVVGQLVAGVSYTAAMAALQDREALLAVACCMYEGLRDEAVTAAVLADSLDACGFVGGSNAAIVRDFVHRSIQSPDTYLAMLDACGQAFVMTSILGLNLCECGDCGVLTFDLPGSDLSYVVNYGYVDSEGNPAQCLHASEWTIPEYDHGRKLDIQVSLPLPQTVAKITWDSYHRNDSFPTGELARYVYLLDDEEEQLALWSGTIEPDKGVWFSDSLYGTPVADVSYIRLVETFVCDCPLTREIRADNIRVFCAT